MTEKRLLAGRYEPVTAMGPDNTERQIYLCRDWHLCCLVAVRKAEKSNLSGVEALKRERDLLLSLSHPRIAPVLDFFVEEDYWYLITSLAVGGNTEKEQNGKPEPGEIEGRRGWERRVIGWGIQICEILEYLHARKPPVVYGDLKPSKLMLDARGQIFLVDFGSAFRLQTEERGDVSDGSVRLAVPERYAGACPASDLRALGTTLEDLLAGVRPSRGLAFLIGRCLDRDPKRRFGSARTVRIFLKLLAVLRKR